MVRSQRFGMCQMLEGFRMFNAPNFDRIPANYSRNPIGTEEYTQCFTQRTLRDSNLSVTLIVLVGLI